MKSGMIVAEEAYDAVTSKDLVSQTKGVCVCKIKLSYEVNVSHQGHGIYGFKY